MRSSVYVRRTLVCECNGVNNHLTRTRTVFDTKEITVQRRNGCCGEGAGERERTGGNRYEGGNSTQRRKYLEDITYAKRLRVGKKT